MSVGAICNRLIPTAAKSTSVRDAAKCMRAFDEPVVVVVDEREGKRVAVGIVTEHEVAQSVVACGADPSQVALQDVMRANPGFVNEADDLLETAFWMHRNRLREAIVHDESGALVGLVTIERLIETLAGDLIGLAEPGVDEAPADRPHALH
ncbi:MAG: CBS domain-containing protein [Betaproteobacteria bacterium]|nr:CBS domain-containing protein [Betaproteobacteria bacterium]